MAVFTRVSNDALQAFLQAYSLGAPVYFEGIEGGIENTNYFLDTRTELSAPTQKWVLTLFENLAEDALPFFMDLTSGLADKGLAVPAPLTRKDDGCIGLLAGKSAVIVPRFPGKAVLAPTSDHCKQVGEWLATFHQLSLQMPLQRPQPRNENWFRHHQQQIAKELPEEDNQLLLALLGDIASSKLMLDQCPKAVIHGDLFRDNVLFQDDKIVGVIDFYNAATDYLLLDVAIAINDWTIIRDGKGRPLGYDENRFSAMTDAYQAIRPWTKAEQQCWPLMLKKAALSFWTSRLISRHQQGYQQQSVVGDPTKDPDEMKAIILFKDR